MAAPTVTKPKKRPAIVGNMVRSRLVRPQHQRQLQRRSVAPSIPTPCSEWRRDSTNSVHLAALPRPLVLCEADPIVAMAFFSEDSL